MNVKHVRIEIARCQLYVKKSKQYKNYIKPNKKGHKLRELMFSSLFSTNQ